MEKKPLPNRVCLCGCGESLQGHRKGAKYFSESCRVRYYRQQKGYNKSRPFVALDGEGIQDRYTLLAAWGKEDTPDVYVESRQGLDTETCLDFLLALSRGSNSGRKPIYVWFAFDYDVNMMLKDIPLKGTNSIEQLKTENTIHWRGYRITYIRRKIFRIARGNRRHTSYDIWGFFQSNFENSLSKWGIESSKIIEQGKNSRAGFNRWSNAKIREYNREELIRLVELAEKLRESVTPLELPIQSWHGPAALAGAWLQKQRAKEWFRPVPSEMFDVTTRAYFGGRIDVAGYGIVDPVYHYDIVSAYPSAIRFLPDLTKLEWKLRQGNPPSGRVYVAKIQWRIPATYWAAFPWRDRHGSILWPLEGEGWYWNTEVETAIEKFGRKYFKIKEYWIAEGEYHYPFQSLIEETFRYRAELKASNNPSHVAVKLVLNSLYGKFAQTVGSAKFYSPIWAGMITAHTRSQLQEAITDKTVCVMTDSVWSSEPINLSIGANLGDWEEQEEQRLYLAEAGLYEAEHSDGSRFVWQRGFDKRNPVDIQGLVTEWLTGDPTYTPVYKVNRFIGMGLATVTHYPWRNWVEIERKIEPVPLVGTTKRLPSHPHSRPLSKTFVHLKPRPRDEDTVSYPYSKLTTNNELVRERLEDECSEE